MTSRRFRLGSSILLVLFPVLASGAHLNHAILFDSRDDEGKYAEGVARFYLGYLDADGKPTNTSLESADGLRKGFDMNGDANALSNCYTELGLDNATFTIITHGDRGLIWINGQGVRGFGTQGTGGQDCGRAPVRLEDTARAHVTVNLGVCNGAQAPEGGRSVARTLQDEIEARNGSVTAMRAIEEEVDIQAYKNWHKVDGAQLTNAEAQALNTALRFDISVHPMLQHYEKFQARLNQAAPPVDGQPRVKGEIKYRVKIGNVITLGHTFPNGLLAGGDEDNGIGDVHTFNSCASCPVGVQESTWSHLKALYRSATR